MQERINVDDTFPCDTAFLAESREQACLQHGGVCTRFTFNKVEQMDLAEFLRAEVPKLSKQLDKLTVIRNATGGCYMVMLGDQVLRYSLKDVVEVPMDALLECYDAKKKGVLAPGIPFPLVCQCTGDNADKCTVLLPAAKHRYIYRPQDYPPFEIYTPPLWFSVRYTKAGGLLGIGVAVLLEPEVDMTKAKLYRWPLSNVHPSGAVCMGQVTTSQQLADNPSVRDMLNFALELFFNSENNDDLINNQQGNAVDELFATSKNRKKFIDMSKGKPNEHLKRLCILSEPDGWMRLKYTPCSNNPRDFCLQ